MQGARDTNFTNYTNWYGFIGNVFRIAQVVKMKTYLMESQYAQNIYLPVRYVFFSLYAGHCSGKSGCFEPGGSRTESIDYGDEE
jgi:hypothetical protein